MSLFWPRSGGVCCCETDTCATICTTVRGGGGAGLLLAGATVTLTRGGSPAGSCTTDADGRCCVPVSAPGTYSGTATKVGYTSTTFSVTVAEGECDVSAPVTKETTVTLPATGQFRLPVKGCNSRPLPGAIVTVTVASTGSPVGTFVTGLDGIAYIHPLAGLTSYNYSITGTRFEDYTGGSFSTPGTTTFDTTDPFGIAMAPGIGFTSCCQCPTGWAVDIWMTDSNGEHFVDGTSYTLCYQVVHANVVALDGFCTPPRTTSIAVGWQLSCAYNAADHTVTFTSRQKFGAVPCGGNLSNTPPPTGWILADSNYCRDDKVPAYGPSTTLIPGTAFECLVPITLSADACSPLLLEFTYPTTMPHPTSGLPVPVPVPGTVIWSE